ncbi:transmembrane channel-like protein 5 [Diachasma alloeum]|uniref:transmembrane channel-like protein 5 n=1 Tax=Diachasma alloeum TaxID=454923 RepID=UPI0007383A7E|nr:transmembrane channel-like protein 5 [Diachasma alloeum]
MEIVDEDVCIRSEVSEGSSAWSEGQVAQRGGAATRRASAQRYQSRHTRHLPSRAIAVLGKASNATLKLVNPQDVSPSPIGSRSQIEDNAETIASHLEMQEDLMQNDPVSEMRRLEALRDMPQCLTVKRSIRAKLTRSINLKPTRRVLSRWKRMKYTMSIFFMKLFIAMREVSSTIELWYGAIKSIEGHFGSGVATYFKFLRWLLILNVINCVLSMFFIVLPQSLFATYGDSTFNFGDFFIGNGFMEETIFYYGFYTNLTIEAIPGLQYNIPSAYILTMIFCYIFTFILLSVKVARSYRKCYIETSGGIHNLYATKIFCGWDYSIASLKAANRCHQSIYRELKELLAESITKKNSNFVKRLTALSIQFSMTAGVLGAMGGTSYLLGYLLQNHKPHSKDSASLLIVPLVVTGIMNIFPVIISQLVKLERYSSKRKSLFVNMIRTYTMTVVIIGTLLAYWLTRSMYYCWQTELAQEIYRLIIFDFLVFTLGSFIMESLRYQLSTFWSEVSAPKFDIALNTLNLIYNQILFWVAFYFSPPLSLVMVVKMILTFYIKKFGLMRHCEPPSTPWRAAQTHTLFLALAFLGMTGTLTALGYVITSVESNSCGPFRNYHYTWHAIIEEVLNLGRDSRLWTVISNFARPGVGAAILIVMIMTVYCLRAKAQASREMVQILREMLVLQSRDKDFLLNEFSKVADEEWLKRRTANENRRSVVSPRQSASLNQKVSSDKRDSTNFEASSPNCSKNYVTFDNEY